MREIEFTTMFSVDPASGLGQAFFDTFTKRQQIVVKRLHMDWPDSWNQLVQYGLSSHGPDVSEVGSTWLGSFETMEALRPWNAGELAALGGERNFAPSAWQSCQTDQSDLLLAVPWVLDTRMVYYRRDWLQKAGVDEADAFSDSGHFVETLKKLRAASHPSPLGLTTSQTNTRLVHDMACWVWSAGGDIRSLDGHRMRLMEPQSRAGLEAYFRLNEFISPEQHNHTELDVAQAFFAGKTAVAILSERVYLEAQAGYSQVITPEALQNLGMAKLMQVPWTGGSALVVWRHASDYTAARELVEFLCGPDSYEVVAPYLPARLDALQGSTLANSPYFPAIQQTLKDGRSFHSGHRWPGVEARLVATIEQLWRDLRTNPSLNIAQEVEKRFSELSTRLEQSILASTW